MANKNHLLDEGIICAAKEEFMRFGFLKASLHKIAEKAGITTGALYTRYKNKDDLFSALIRIPTDDFKERMSETEQLYETSRRSKSADDFIRAIQQEENFYLDFLFRYYDECVLLLCKSDGSSVWEKLQSMIQMKTETSAEFFKSIASRPFDADGVEMILYGQMSLFRQILEKGYDKEKAFSAMKQFDVFVEAGWKAIFEQCVGR